MPDDNNVTNLIRRLDYATRQGLVTWRLTDRKNAFLYSGSSSGVLLYSQDDDGKMPFVLDILDSTGNVVDTVRSHGRGTYTGRYEPIGTSGRALAALYERVRRQALRVDDRIEQLLDELPDFPDALSEDDE